MTSKNMSKAKKLVNQDKAKELIEKRNPQKKIVFAFPLNNSFSSVSFNGFTNFHKNKDELIRNFHYLFNEIMPIISNMSLQELNDKTKRKEFHYHKLENERPLVVKVLSSMKKKHHFAIQDELYDYYIKDSEFYQIGCQSVSEMRIVFSIRENNIFEILFVDFNHLINSNVKYNTEDYKHYLTELKK